MRVIEELKKEIKRYADPEKAELSGRYFKTGKEQYAEGDVFLGLMVPRSRKIASMFGSLVQDDIEQLLHSQFHEERLIALFILVDQFKNGAIERKKEIYEFYLLNTKYINNWDLVDSSADKIVGEYLLAQCHDEPIQYEPHGRRFASASSSNKTLKQAAVSEPRQVPSGTWPRYKRVQGEKLKILKDLATSQSIWERRIAILSTFAFIRVGRVDVTYDIADFLLHDTHDLIHKAVGWLLREAGKRVSEEGEEAFLRTRYKAMPRTMLRYAIERFPKEKREKYLNGEI